MNKICIDEWEPLISPASVILADCWPTCVVIPWGPSASRMMSFAGLDLCHLKHVMLNSTHRLLSIKMTLKLIILLDDLDIISKFL